MRRPMFYALCLLLTTLLTACEAPKETSEPIAVEAVEPDEPADEKAEVPQAAPEGPKMVVEVGLPKLKENGKHWDAMKGEPDIAICVELGGKETCYPGEKTPAELQKPKCKNALSCAFTGIPVPSGDFVLTVIDVDAMDNDQADSALCSISTGRCAHRFATAKLRLPGVALAAKAAQAPAAVAEAKPVEAQKPAEAVQAREPEKVPEPPPQASPFDTLLSRANKSLDGYDIGDNYWFLENKRNPCPDRDDDESDFIGLPPGDNEFQRQRNGQKRAQLKADVSKDIYRVPLEEVWLGKYDFKKNKRRIFGRAANYTFTGTARTDCDSYGCDWEVEPLGPKPTRDALKLDVPIDPEFAEQLGDSEDAYQITVLVRVTGLYRHTRCVRSCLFGVCGSDNIGAGVKLKGKLVGVRVEAHGKRLYEKVHEKL